MKQTAVEWLFFMLNNPNRNQEFAKKLLDKAKEIEEKQIIDAYNDGWSNSDLYEFYPAEKYYNETFKSE